jgi:hypothetical protein
MAQVMAFLVSGRLNVRTAVGPLMVNKVWDVDTGGFS